MPTITSTIIDGYLDWAAHRARLADSTIDAYTRVLDHYARWLDDRCITTVTPADVEDFGNRDRDGKKPSAATARRDIVVVRNVHEWASERDFAVRRVSSARSPKVAGRVPKPVDDDVWAKVWNCDLDIDDRLFIGIGYFFGLRRIELVTFAPDNVDLDTGTMTFVRKGGSTQPIEYRAMFEIVAEKLPHLCRANDGFLAEFDDLVRSRQGEEWVWPDSTGHVSNDCSRLNKRLSRGILPRAGVPTDAITPHRLRHSCATNLLRAGVEPAFIMDALSHADITTTMKYMKTSGQLARWKEKPR